ncbi:MAG: zinc ribbon domain-containing protein [Phycisphaerae bacterium]|nr:zinc ribbon domain-containing protein [Phycisphaerae bacterium]
MLEIFVQRPKEDVDSSLVQFAARRSYRISKPWYLDSIRIETPSPTHGASNVRRFWAAMFDSPLEPRIDVETRRKRSGTRVRVVIANTPESTRLAYELHSFLLDDRSFDRNLPTICPRCSTPISNLTSRYCGRCGHKLVANGLEPRIREFPGIVPPVPEEMTSRVRLERDASPPKIEQPATNIMEQSFERPVRAMQMPPVTAESSDNANTREADSPESESANPESPNSDDSGKESLPEDETGIEKNKPEPERQSETEGHAPEQVSAEPQAEAEAESDSDESHGRPDRRALAEE